MCREALVLVVLSLPFVGCMPDDWNGEPYAGPEAATDEPPIGGTWVSEGADLSDLFAADPFRYVRVEAVFEAGLDYAVTSTDADGATYTLTGTYAADDATVPGTVLLAQVAPYEAEAEGIWQIEGDALTWEVVQTVPDYGFVPPTPESGFGTTGGPGLEAGANVQIYRGAP